MIEQAKQRDEQAFLALIQRYMYVIRAVIAKYIQRITGYEEEDCLSQLVPHIQGLKAKHLRAFEKIVKKQPDLPETFRQTVIAALPKAKGLKKVFRKLFGRS